MRSKSSKRGDTQERNGRTPRSAPDLIGASLASLPVLVRRLILVHSYSSILEEDRSVDPMFR
jgi:hypothetical protein